MRQRVKEGMEAAPRAVAAVVVGSGSRVILPLSVGSSGPCRAHEAWARHRASGRSGPETSLAQSTVCTPTCGLRSLWAVARSTVLLAVASGPGKFCDESMQRYAWSPLSPTWFEMHRNWLRRPHHHPRDGDLTAVGRAELPESLPTEGGSTGNAEGKSSDPRLVPARCPFGYDSGTFKLGPLSCMICQALLHECSRCNPCSHKFCKACVLRFKDCPLCGADIDGIEPDPELQALVDRFIDGHAQIKRSHASGDEEVLGGKNKVIYEDVSMERGAFLVQQAMRAFRAQNIGSAKSRLSMCAEDIREELKSSEDNLDLRSQLGAVLGMLGDCCRTLGDSPSAISYYEESAEFLSKLPVKDLELVHTLSVSLNKIGDVRYYDGDLQSARSYYSRSLDVRRNAVKEHSAVASQPSNLEWMYETVAEGTDEKDERVFDASGTEMDRYDGSLLLWIQST
ncbi:E3 ubiquitin-protein ligase CHFR-like [Panicum miliaceum]|uniref:E3 ubiquitin-protein ligase CHFR-like n=1 Tax=Panicum miliaceum TaxID=4540 RepID=A0A3L6PKX5_PANMI|nr:E3 ubiquitin-protein ligase CHFR-like [Panicum miliaceum]